MAKHCSISIFNREIFKFGLDATYPWTGKMTFSRDARIFYALKILFKIARLSFKTTIDVAQCFLQKEFYLGQNPFLMTFPRRSLTYLHS